MYFLHMLYSTYSYSLLNYYNTVCSVLYTPIKHKFCATLVHIIYLSKLRVLFNYKATCDQMSRFRI
jgi:hypothetical protein